MHYLGMEAMSMPDSMRYNAPLFVLSVVIALVAGTAGAVGGHPGPQHRRDGRSRR